MPLQLLRDGFTETTVFYANSNIHPAAEYERRRDTLREYAYTQDIPVVELPYVPLDWIDAIANTADAPDTKKRCEQCYRIRFAPVIEAATQNGYTHFATSLTVSPYQYQKAIELVAHELCQKYGLIYAGRNFSEHYPEATRRSRELDMYRQNYCGCLLSDIEAQGQRAQRKASRKAQV